MHQIFLCIESQKALNRKKRQQNVDLLQSVGINNERVSSLSYDGSFSPLSSIHQFASCLKHSAINERIARIKGRITKQKKKKKMSFVLPPAIKYPRRNFDSFCNSNFYCLPINVFNEHLLFDASWVSFICWNSTFSNIDLKRQCCSVFVDRPIIFADLLREVCVFQRGSERTFWIIARSLSLERS